MKFLIILLLIISCKEEKVNIPTFQPLQSATPTPTPFDFETEASTGAEAMEEKKSAGCGAEEEIDPKNFDPLKPKKKSGCSAQ